MPLFAHSVRRTLVIARYRKSQPIVLGESVDKQPVQNIIEPLPRDAGESDALHICSLQKRAELGRRQKPSEVKYRVFESVFRLAIHGCVN